jgi:hypothetical protein
MTFAEAMRVTHCLHGRKLEDPCKDCEHDIKHPRARKRANKVPQAQEGWPA